MLSQKFEDSLFVKEYDPFLIIMGSRVGWCRKSLMRSEFFEMCEFHFVGKLVIDDDILFFYIRRVGKRRVL